MITLFAFKKILFTLILGSGIVTPVITTSPIIKEINKWSQETSPFKEGIRNLEDLEIYIGEKLKDFISKSLMYPESQDILIESFAQELSKSWFLSQPKSLINTLLFSWEEERRDNFQKNWKELSPEDPQRDFWDNNWGSEENMKAYNISSKSFMQLKSFLTEFSLNNYRLNTKTPGWFKNDLEENKNQTNWESWFIGKYENSNILNSSENAENISKIGFYPIFSHLNPLRQKDIILKKYDFINWSYREWFKEVFPVYFWYLSWDYDDISSHKELEKEYNLSHFKGSFPHNSGYKFPLFSPETTSKFNSFITSITSSSTSSSASDTQNNGGAQSTLSSLLQSDIDTINKSFDSSNNSALSLFELLNSFETETVGLASAVNYLSNTAITPTSSNNNYVSHVNSINQSRSSLRTPIEWFLDSRFSSNSRSMRINPKIFTQNFGSKMFISEALHLDNDWIIFRDEKGVHALKLDGLKYLKSNTSNNGTTNAGKKEISGFFDWFNLRNLQLLHSNLFRLGGSYISAFSQNWFDQFHSYLDLNFSSMLVKYFSEKASSSHSLFSGISPSRLDYLTSYKELFTTLFKLKKEKVMGQKIFTLRKKIIEKYGKNEWDKSISTSYFSVPSSEGVSSPFPYRINNTEANKNIGRFPDQEEIIYKIHSYPESKESNATTLSSVEESKIEPILNSQILELISKYWSSIQNLLNNSKIGLKMNTRHFNYMHSQRIFILDPVFNYFLNSLFEKKNLLNYLVKENKLLNSSFFTQNKLLNISDNNPPYWSYLVNPERKETKLKTLFPSLTSATSVSNSSASTNNNVNIHSWLNTTTISDSSNQDSRKLLFSLLKTFLFKEYLSNVQNDYLNFWIDFSTLIPPKKMNNMNTKESTTSQKDQNNIFDDYTFSRLLTLWQQVSLTSSEHKDKFLNFLITLHYLTQNDFENLKKYMGEKLQDKYKLHYLKFTSLKYKAWDHFFNNTLTPYLQVSNTKTIFNSISEIRTAIRERWRSGGVISNQNLDHSGRRPRTQSEVILEGIVFESNSYFNSPQNLFNFQDLEHLLKYISNLKSSLEFEKLVYFLGKFIPQIDPKFYDSDYLLVSTSKDSRNQQNSTTSSALEKQRFYLELKKSFLTYNLNNINERFSHNQNIEDQTWKKITEKSSNETSNGSHKLSDHKLFNRNTSIDPGDYLIFPISDLDFADSSSISKLFSILTGNLFSEFLIKLTDQKEIQLQAQEYFFNNTYKLKSYDIKFQNNIENKHINY